MFRKRAYGGRTLLLDQKRVVSTKEDITSRGSAILAIESARKPWTELSLLRDVRVANLVAYHGAKAGLLDEAEQLIATRIARIVSHPDPLTSQLVDALFDLVLNRIVLNRNGEAGAELDQLSECFELEKSLIVRVATSDASVSIKLTGLYAGQIDMERAMAAWRSGRVEPPPRSLIGTPLFRELELRQRLASAERQLDFELQSDFTLKRAIHALLVWSDEGHGVSPNIVEQLTRRFLDDKQFMTFAGASTPALWLTKLKALVPSCELQDAIRTAIDEANTNTISSVRQSLDELIGRKRKSEGLDLKDLISSMVGGTGNSVMIEIV